jgi:hypothetical protein
MLDVKPFVRRRTSTLDGIIPYLFRCTYHIRTIVQISFCIQIKVRDMISQLIQPCISRRITGRVGRTHVSGKITENISKGNFVVNHLVPELRAAQGCETLMRPCVTGDLVTVANHAADEPWPWCIGVVDGAFSEVATGDVECCFSIVAL